MLHIIPTLLVYPYLAFVPIYTAEVLGFGKNASADGFLMSAVGFGSLVGAADHGQELPGRAVEGEMEKRLAEDGT